MCYSLVFYFFVRQYTDSLRFAATTAPGAAAHCSSVRSSYIQYARSTNRETFGLLCVYANKTSSNEVEKKFILKTMGRQQVQQRQYTHHYSMRLHFSNTATH